MIISRFSDVPGDAWTLPFLERLADLGVVEPYEDGTFRPYEPLTRFDMAVFLARASPAHRRSRLADKPYRVGCQPAEPYRVSRRLD